MKPYPKSLLMAEPEEVTDLQQLLDRIQDSTPRNGRISLEAILETLGRRSFGPIILTAGLFTLSPIGDIPGTPTIIAFLVLLVSVQLLAHRPYFWLPRWLLRRSVGEASLEKSLKWLRPPARFIDRFLKERLTFFASHLGNYLVAVTCTLIALAMPPMEFVPFSATGAGAALTLFGLALIAHDGLLALVAFALTASTMVAVLGGLT